MVQLWPTAPAAVDIHHVEAVQIPWPAVPKAPDLSHPSQCPALAPADRLSTSAEGLTMSRLHLDKGDQHASAHHQIQFVPSNAKPVRFDTPARVAEMDDGEFLPLKTEPMPGIGPLVGGNGSGG